MKNFSGFVVPALLLAACASAPGGMYSKPYALFQPETKLVRGSDDNAGAPAYVIKIDGVSIPHGRIDPVDPGMRKVEVALTGPQGTAVEKTYPMQIDAKACTRYYLSLRRTTTGGDWVPFISGTDKIGECASRFGGS
jgi:hypothetical protein